MSQNKSLQEIINFRIDKLNKIKDSNSPSFEYSFKESASIKNILIEKSKWMGRKVKICGRIVSFRKMGKASFIHIQGGDEKMQLYVKTNNLPTNVYDDIVRNLDIGDIIGTTGEVFLTKTKELSIKSSDISILAKNIRPLPNLKEKDGETFFSFDDKELRYRNRHLDLITNPSIKKIFKKRSLIVKTLRETLDQNGFLEVETPVLQPIYGGANARPFTTHHNTLNQKLYLRIASELYLKRLIIGGLDKVYEIGKNFRNEGMDKSHNPEFTMLEFYESYSDINDMILFTEKIFQSICKNLDVKNVEFNNHKVNLSKKFNIISMKTLFERYLGKNIIELSESDILKISKENKLDIDKKSGKGKMIEKIFSQVVEPNLIQPTFVVDYPVEISPLARFKREDGSGRYVERFELFISGVEIANAFSELNDSEEQKKRLMQQSSLLKKGDGEAHMYDEDFIKALEVGMPPTGGVGIGVDRLVMLFLEQKTIKDVILFPSMRPE